jgi:NADPH:quinone reductase-like Zn-dependent oxidoreductase
MVICKKKYLAYSKETNYHQDFKFKAFIELIPGWSAIVTTGNLSSHSSPQKILIAGAAGGVGTFAVQLLKAWNHEVS